ncbi:hypothetical protein Patl1_29544 [Pistacia atlantica]|uniref:Uncharacterized protein n=1 Tax=Pistacia atlantica TaxID=434234 RepID=A0ACC1AA93_9ROSI|nr:hypothetical protein Patl1_29544 [Pistacia atlantica]
MKSRRVFDDDGEFLKLDKAKNKSASGICGADDEKRSRLLKEKDLKNPMKEENSSARVSPRKGRKLLCDAMKSRRDFSDEEHGIYQQKKKLKGEVNLIDIPESLKEYIEKKQNGTEIKRLIQKSLHFSDVYQNRFSIPVNQVEQEFLTPEEKEIVEKAGKLIVFLIEPSLEVREIVLAKWNGLYVLITGWNNVKARNELKEGDEVQVWSFRSSEKLSLALVILQRS